MGVLKVKPGVDFGDSLSFAGARILEVLKDLVSRYDFDVTITSARDGKHSGPNDPHHKGDAFDLRVRTLTVDQIRRLVSDLRLRLYKEPRKFYAFHEAAGTANAHIHCQRRAGTIYTVDDYLANA